MYQKDHDVDAPKLLKMLQTWTMDTDGARHAENSKTFRRES